MQSDPRLKMMQREEDVLKLNFEKMTFILMYFFLCRRMEAEILWELCRILY